MAAADDAAGLALPPAGVALLDVDVAAPPPEVVGAVVAAVVAELSELFDEQAANRPTPPTPINRSIERRLIWLV